MSNEVTEQEIESSKRDWDRSLNTSQDEKIALELSKSRRSNRIPVPTQTTKKSDLSDGPEKYYKVQVKSGPKNNTQNVHVDEILYLPKSRIA